MYPAGTFISSRCLAISARSRASSICAFLCSSASSCLCLRTASLTSAFLCSIVHYFKLIHRFSNSVRGYQILLLCSIPCISAQHDVSRPDEDTRMQQIDGMGAATRIHVMVIHTVLEKKDCRGLHLIVVHFEADVCLGPPACLLALLLPLNLLQLPLHLCSLPLLLRLPHRMILLEMSKFPDIKRIFLGISQKLAYGN